MVLIHKLYYIMTSFFSLPNCQEPRSSANVIEFKVKRLFHKAETIEHCFEWQLAGAKYSLASVYSATCLLPSLCLMRELFCHIE
jgi:hypothetical protein